MYELFYLEILDENGSQGVFRVVPWSRLTEYVRLSKYLLRSANSKN